MVRNALVTLALVVVFVGCGADRRRGPGVDAGPAVGDAGVGDAGPALDSGPSDDAGSGDDAGADGTYVVDFDTTAGAFALEVHPDWAPLGAARFRELVEVGYFDECRFFRVVPGFVAQFGINGDPAVNSMWSSSTIADDPVVESNTYGTVTFATAGPGTRTTQLFINYGDNSFLDTMGFSPFAMVIEGMGAVEGINAEYGETPNQAQIQSMGNAYLDASFPNLDYIRTATVR